jgi:hypothetical protein
MASKPRPSTRSSNPKTTGGRQKPAAAKPRAHREDTFEAREQRRRAPKTHFPSRTAGAHRKDKAPAR